MTSSSSAPFSKVHSIPEFEYAHFPNPHSIRILTLQPSLSEDAPLVGDLEIESLDDPDLNYAAISYVWGKPSRCAEIICNGARLLLTQSIHDALVRMRYQDKPRRLWADQICINQGNIAERSKQVELMNLVYKNASKVLVWLGTDLEGYADAAFRLLKYLDTVFSDQDAHKVFRTAHSEELAKQKAETWMPLTKFTRLPWFHRIWIVQEIGTLASSTLYWGNAEIDWETVSSVVAILNEQYHHLRSKFYIGTPNIRYLYRRFVEPDVDFDQHHNRGSFVYELHRARHMLAEDPRDHVYAFLGHFSLCIGSSALASLTADYSRSVEEVYCDVAIRALTGAESLIVLSTNHNGGGAHQPYGSRRLGQTLPDNLKIKSLPSWVPDWREVPRHIIGSPETPHRASGTSTPRLFVNSNDLALHVYGVHLDTIARHSWVVHGNAFQFSSHPSSGSVTPIEELWRKVCNFSHAIDLKVPYGHGSSESAFFALAQTLTNACVGLDRTRPYESIPKSEWLAHAAAYLVRASGSKARIDPDLRTFGRNCDGDAFQWSHEATLVTRYKSFAITGQGYFVLGPKGMEDGDVVTVLFGGRTPFLLRRRGDRQVEGWELIGECYVHGMMNGEALKKKGVHEEEFTIY